jgi:transcriptional regulator with XRE-family HTH domain
VAPFLKQIVLMKSRNKSGRRVLSSLPFRSQERALLREFGARLRKELFFRKKDVDWLAQEAGLARSTTREIVAGRSNPRLSTICMLAAALGFKECGELLGGIAYKKSSTDLSAVPKINHS